MAIEYQGEKLIVSYMETDYNTLPIEPISDFTANPSLNCAVFNSMAIKQRFHSKECKE